MSDAVPAESSSVHIIRVLLHCIFPLFESLRQVLLLGPGCLKAFDSLASHPWTKAWILFRECLYGILLCRQGLHWLSRSSKEPLSGIIGRLLARYWRLISLYHWQGSSWWTKSKKFVCLLQLSKQLKVAPTRCWPSLLFLGRSNLTQTRPLKERWWWANYDHFRRCRGLRLRLSGSISKHKHLTWASFDESEINRCSS